MRSYKEIDESKVIDPIIKQDFKSELTYFYMTIIDARGGDFIISDIYPTLEVFPLANGVNYHMHLLFPITPSRILVLNNVMFTF